MPAAYETHASAYKSVPAKMNETTRSRRIVSAAVFGAICWWTAMNVGCRGGSAL